MMAVYLERTTVEQKAVGKATQTVDLWVEHLAEQMALHWVVRKAASMAACSAVSKVAHLVAGMAVALVGWKELLWVALLAANWAYARAAPLADNLAAPTAACWAI